MQAASNFFQLEVLSSQVNEYLRAGPRKIEFLLVDLKTCHFISFKYSTWRADSFKN